jgi:hypothetical protein
MEGDFEGNFLHNLPKALTPKQRVALEAISFALDSIEQNYLRLIEYLSNFPNPKLVLNLQRRDRVSIFTDIWTIIDNCHSILQLISGFEKKNKKEQEKVLDFVIDGRGSKTNIAVKEYFQAYNETIRTLRNKMDHLSGNLSAIIEKRTPQEPLFGSLSYILSNPQDCASHEFDVVVVASTVFTGGVHTFSALNPADIRRKIIFHPVDHLQFSAFGSTKIKLTDLYEDSMNIRNIMNTDMADGFAESLRKYASENGMNEKELFETLPGEMVFGMHVKMVSDNEL